MADGPGQTAFVFGGAGGIGGTLCLALLQRKYKVVCCDINLPKFDTSEYKDAFLGVKCDITKEEAIEGAFAAAKEKFSEPVQVVLNCAGYMHESEWKKCVDINLIGTIQTSFAALRHMSKDKGHKGGIVINMASIFGVYPFANAPVYTATKHGIIGLTRAWAMPVHYEKTGVKFAIICPNNVETEMRNQISPAHLYHIQTLVPEPTLKPEEMIEPVMDMIEDDDINGAIVMVSASFPEKVRRFVPPENS